MLTESEKRALLLAVSKFAPDRAVDQRAFRDALDAFGGDDLTDFLRSLVQDHILTPLQANKIKARYRALVRRNGRHAKSATTRPKKNSDGLNGSPSIAPTLMALKKEDSPNEEPDTEVGTAVGEYHILRKLGQGGMCAVYLGYRESTNQKVAIKILPATLALRQDYLDRFYREAKSGTILNHHNIVRNLAFGQDHATGRHYLVMEYVDGPTAHDLLELYTRLSIGDAVHIILDICRGLEHAHSRNIIHRDIKPGNILLTRTGIAKLADMGLAKRTDETTSHLTGTHQGFGTPYYMPYEQAINARHADGRSDIYALGATFYHLLTGEVPFPGESHLEIVENKSQGNFAPPNSVNPSIPDVLNRIIEKMMARDPQDRYQTISEVIVALERSNLTPALPSFIDENLAFHDPLVRERLTSSAQPTSPDLRLNRTPEAPVRKNEPHIWYLRYRTGGNQWCKAKVTTRQVIKRLREKKIPSDAEVSRALQGEYYPLAHFTEFQPVLVKLGTKRKKRLPRPVQKEKKKLPVRKQQEAPPTPAPPAPAAAQSFGWGVVGAGVLLATIIFGIVVFIIVQMLVS